MATTPTVPRSDGGFSLIELVIAVVVMAIGVLGFLSMNAFLARQTTYAGLQTERTAALVSALEYVNGLPYDSVVNGNDSVGRYEVSWTVSTPEPAAKRVHLITLGPGLSSRGSTMPILQADVADTFVYTVLEP